MNCSFALSRDGVNRRLSSDRKEACCRGPCGSKGKGAAGPWGASTDEKSAVFLSTSSISSYSVTTTMPLPGSV